MIELTEWDSFYVIVGAAAGALIGLQFVVMALIAEKPPIRAAEAGAAFATPTIIHFSITLFLAALLRAPWHTIMPIAVLLGLTGIFGVIYIINVGWRMRMQKVYRPVFEDWFFRLLLPMLAYLILFIAAFVSFISLCETLFGIGASALILLFTGIHNAWDNVAYHVLVSKYNTKNDKV